MARTWDILEQRGLTWKSGVVGSGLIGLGMLVSGLAYVGRLGERYNPLNHFVSELGEPQVSEAALAFNLGLLLGGFCLVAFMLGVARRIGGWQGALFGVGGVICAVSGALVGVFPMNNLAPHIFWAMNFFNGGLWVMIWFSLVVLIGRPGLPRWLALPGMLSASAFASFKWLPGSTTGGGDSLAAVDAFLSVPRPAVWGMAVFEWLAVLAVLLWVMIVALALGLMEKSHPEP